MRTAVEVGRLAWYLRTNILLHLTKDIRLGGILWQVLKLDSSGSQYIH
jgi:hypothetical protein